MNETWIDNANDTEGFTVHGNSPEQMTPVEMLLQQEAVLLEQFTGEREDIADLYQALTERALTEIVNHAE